MTFRLMGDEGVNLNPALASLFLNPEVGGAIMLRRLVTALAVLPLFATVGLLSSASPAAAAKSHWVAGTYQLFIQGNGTQILVLLDNHTVGPPPNSGTWAVQKPKHEVTVNVAGGRSGHRLPACWAGSYLLFQRPIQRA